MKAVVFHGPHDVRVDDVPEPVIEEPGDVILRIDRTAICGSDLHPYDGRMPMESGVVLGHEYAGTVVSVGSAVNGFDEGDQAVGSFLVICGRCWFCRRSLFMKCLGARMFGFGMLMGDLPGAQAEYLRVPDADLTLRKIPNDALDDLLLVGDVLTTGYEAVLKGNMRPGDVIAVLGAGAVGLSAVMSAVALGAGVVVAIDPVHDRRKLAEQLGAVVVDPNETDAEDVVLELTDWRGADLVVDAVGHEAALRATVPLVRPGGTISVAGGYIEEEMTLPIGDIWLKNVTLVTGIANIHAHIDETIALVRTARLDASVIVSHCLPLTDAAEGYALFHAREAVKVVLEPRI